MFDIIGRNWPELTDGLLVTLELCGICWGVSIFAGGLLGVLGARWREWIGLPSQIISLLLSGIPPIVFLFWLHYPAQSLIGVIVDPFVTGNIALSILGTFMVADSVRNALLDFPQQYVVAAQTCGLSDHDILVAIKIPLMIRQLLPNILGICILILQMTLFTSFISVDELFRAAQRINSIEYRPIEIFSALALFLMAICVPLHALCILLRDRYSRNISER